MRILLIVMALFLLFLAACGNNNGNNNANQQAQNTLSPGEPTPVPSPTVTPLPTLPPANPIPTRVYEGHIYAVDGRVQYVVQPGDTLSGIAAQYNVSVKELADANRIYNYDLIEVGDIIYIPYNNH